MDVPAAFDKLTNPLHQDWQIVYATFDEALADCPKLLTAAEKLMAKGFLIESWQVDTRTRNSCTCGTIIPSEVEAAFV
jgi:hypothetical protein